MLVCYNVYMVLTPEYIAGMIDSDGSISIIKRTRQTTTRGYQYRELVQVTWAYSPLAEAVFLHLKERYGGSVFKTVKRANDYTITDRPIVKYTAEAKAAQRLLEEIQPYLVLKQWQADNALAMRKLKAASIYGSGREKPAEVWEQEDKLYANTLKQRARGRQ